MTLVAHPLMRFCWLSDVCNALVEKFGFETPQFNHLDEFKGLQKAKKK